jgi:hypothetical protein
MKTSGRLKSWKVVKQRLLRPKIETALKELTPVLAIKDAP